MQDPGTVAVLLASLVLTGAACALAALTATQRFAGPWRRLERYFEALARGEDPGPCRLRKGDVGQELCTLVNRVTASLRAAEAPPAEIAGPEPTGGPVPAPPEGRAERVRSGA